MTKKRVLLVGAATGLGYLLAERLLGRGAIVYAAAPDLEPMQSLADAGAHLLRMDVTDTALVRAGVRQMIAEQGEIDCVHFNAGINTPGPIEAVSEKAVEALYQVNLFGAARVIRAVTPQLRKQRRGRVVFTSSAGGHATAIAMGWYCSTKFALRAIVSAYRLEVEAFGIEVVLIEPGAVRTGFDRDALDRLEAMDCPEDYRPAVQQYRNWVEDLLTKSPLPEGTVNAMEEAILATRPKKIYRTTLEAKLIPYMSAILSPDAFDRFVRKSYAKYGSE